MALQCNIDSKGKAVRLIYGIVMILVAIVLAAVWARSSGGVFSWIVVLIVFASGAFSIFEGWSGWCALRALGFKTPL
jgi:hypothetical protein